MYIRWKYVDHAHPDFKELEIPDDLDGESTVEDYICERGLVPTWSERFMVGRIKWEKLSKPSRKTVENQIADLKLGRKWRLSKLKQLNKLLESI